MSRKEISAKDNLARMLTAIAAVGATLMLVFILFRNCADLFGMDGLYASVSADTFSNIQLWGLAVVAALVAMAGAVRQSFVLFLVVAIIIAAIVILWFFPGVTTGFFPAA